MSEEKISCHKQVMAEVEEIGKTYTTTTSMKVDCQTQMEDTVYKSSHDMGENVQSEVYDGPSAEIESMRKEIQALDEEKALLQKSEEVRKVREELKAKRKEVKKLRGTSLHGTL